MPLIKPLPVLFANDTPLALIAGPCVIESPALTEEIAGRLKEITDRLRMGFVFKASFDKANRTSYKSFRGPGLEDGLAILERVRKAIGCQVLTDVHEDTPVDEVAAVVDVLQTPALLCRQTDFITRVAQAGKPVNLKKGQFLSPAQMVHVAEKAQAAGNDRVMLCERGSCFGYGDLVVDMRGLAVMKQTQLPVIFDATHSVQQPGALGATSGGQRRFVGTLARAAVAVGVAGVFFETHPHPDSALSDGPNMVPLNQMEDLLRCLQAIDQVVKAPAVR